MLWVASLSNYYYDYLDQHFMEDGIKTDSVLVY